MHLPHRCRIVSIGEIGVADITSETGHPHAEWTWPHTRAVALRLVEGLLETAAERIMRGNAIDMLRLECG